MIKIICLIILGLCGIFLAVSTFITFIQITKNQKELDRLRKNTFSAHTDEKERKR